MRAALIVLFLAAGPFALGSERRPTPTWSVTITPADLAPMEPIKIECGWVVPVTPMSFRIEFDPEHKNRPK